MRIMAEAIAERIRRAGTLLVVTGASGAGKDTVAEEVLKHPNLLNFNLRRLITCADRSARPGEIHGVHYYFVSPEELDRMHKNSELVENPQPTGSSRKGTPKKEFTNVLSGQSLLWRIDPYLAAHVAKGDFFKEQFGALEGEILRQSTIVISVTSPREVIEQRRKSRDAEKYDPKEYELRDMQEAPSLATLNRYAVLVENVDGMLSQTVEYVANTFLNHHTSSGSRHPRS